MTDEDTGSTAKTTKRKTASAGSRASSKPRSTSTATSTTSKAASTKAAATTASPASTKDAATSAPETTAAIPAAAPAAAAPAASTGSPSSGSGAGGSGAGGSGAGGSGAGGSGTGGAGTGGSGGSGGGYTRVPAPQPSQSSGSGLVSLPTILSIAAIVIAILIPVLKDRAVEPAVKPEEINALKVQQSELIAAVANLEASIEAVGVDQDTMRASIQAVKVPSIMIAATDLNDAITGGEPFQEELTLFRAIVGDNDAVASVYALEALAGAGVPTTRELQAGFGDVSHAVIAAYQTVESEGDLAKRVSETMANLTAATTRLRWRLDGASPPEGDSPLAIMARAENAAEVADFDAVVMELESLPENLKAMVADWIAQVEAQQKAETATEDLELFMIETVASTRK